MRSGEAEPNGNRYRIRFGALREAGAQKFEGLSLLLKSMKKNGRVAYEGPILMDSAAIITLLPA